MKANSVCTSTCVDLPGFAWEVQRGGRRRQLANSKSEDSPSQSKTKSDPAASILPGKALIVGNNIVNQMSPSKNGKGQMGGAMQQMPTHYPFGMMPQQQFSPQGDAQGMVGNMGMMPQWNLPQGVMANGGMNYPPHPVAASAMHIMYAAKSNNPSRTRSDPPSDPPMAGYGMVPPMPTGGTIGLPPHMQMQMQMPQPLTQQQ